MTPAVFISATALPGHIYLPALPPPGIQARAPHAICLRRIAFP